MSFLGKLFGRKKDSPKTVSPTTPANTTDPAKDPNLIRVFDSYGRELFITRQEWRDKVLLGNLKQVWDQPDELYGMIIGALNDGFRSDVVEAARQLHKIDPDITRGACIWGIVLMEEGRLDEAEKVFREHTDKHGEAGVILTNLAKVYAKRKDDLKAEKILWHALELDPNQDNGMAWYEAIHRERGGEAASLEALRRVAAIPASWRAQLWLARAAIQSRELEKAILLYRESLSRAPIPAPTDLLMQISGDLGNAGHLPELLELVEPGFDAAIHGLLVGNNLIKAYLDLGQTEAARRITDLLYALKRPDWRETLSFWDTEIAKAKLDPDQPDDAQALKIALLSIDGPVWLRPDSPATELFPAKIQEDGPLLSFLGSSAEVASNSQRIQQQLADWPGRMSRAIPLFLAEQVEFSTTASVKTLVPWVTSGASGFVLSGGSWSDGAAANYARQSNTPSDYVITIHLKTQAEPWVTQLRLIRTIDSKCLAELHCEFPAQKPEASLPGLAKRLIASILSETAATRLPQSPLYQLPPSTQLSFYLLRLEQLLAVRCGAMDGVTNSFLSGEREIIDGNIQLCLDCPKNVPARLLLAQTLIGMKRVRPKILSEFSEKLTLLQKEQALPEPSQSVVQRIINEAIPS